MFRFIRKALQSRKRDNILKKYPFGVLGVVFPYCRGVRINGDEIDLYLFYNVKDNEFYAYGGYSYLYRLDCKYEIPKHATKMLPSQVLKTIKTIM